MTLLYSTSGFWALVNALFHGTCIISAIVLLGYAIHNIGKRRKTYMAAFVFVIGLYGFWIYTDLQKKKEGDKYYTVQYSLTKYEGCLNCIIQLYPNQTFKVFNEKRMHESGKWEHFYDGDLSIIKFSNGGHLGFDKYEHERK
jgi:hypothetical protein